VLIAGVVIVLGIWVMRTPVGLAVDLIGANRSLAAQGGLRPDLARVGLLLFSAGTAGIAGAIQLFGVSHRLTPGLTAGVGYTGLLVAVIGRARPLNTALAAVIFAFLTLGGEALEREGVPRAVSLIAQGLVVVGVALQGRNR
jgi:simple sugar transport system permease protein